MEKKIALEVKKLKIGYPKNKSFKELVEAFSFKLYEGELVAILGANGTGKSTLLRTISKENTYKGTIKIYSEDISLIKSKVFAQQISSVGTNYQVQSYTTVKDVISKGRSVHTNWIGKLTKKDEEIVIISADKVGVKQLLNRFFNTLSDGEKQRTLLAMALAQQAKIILLDEPTAFIDYPNKYFLTSLLRELSKKENKMVLFSSHDLEVVLKYSDKIILFSDTKVELVNTRNFLNQENILKLFNHHQLNNGFKEDLLKHLRRRVE